MLIKRKVEEMGKNNLGWLNALFHFSFDHYYDPQHMSYGVLRVVNDDLIGANTGFPMHPHRDMEIITYVVEGQLTHGDSMGNQSTVKRGEIQYMSAGTGVYHSESNETDQTIRSLQIWIYPNQKNLTPNYGDYAFKFEDRLNKWLHMVSPVQGGAPVEINQDANIYSLYLAAGQSIDFPLSKGRQGYLVQIEGNSTVNQTSLNEREALMFHDETITLKTTENAHYILFEMEQDR